MERRLIASARLPCEIVSRASSTTLRTPWRARPSAVARPTGPAPRITTSADGLPGRSGGLQGMVCQLKYMGVFFLNEGNRAGPG